MTPAGQGRVDPSFTPLVLLVDDQEWTSRSIESILRPRGHVVLKAYTGGQALDLVHKVNPDLIIVDFHLPDVDGVDVARRLRGCPSVHSVTPLLMISASSIGRAERLNALAAGAWDILRHPVDPEELIVRVETLVRAKQEADRIREDGLTDPRTGFYNAKGLLRRTQEVSADAQRSERPLSCVAFGPDWVAASETPERIPDRELLDDGIAQTLRTGTRVSDTLGRLGSGEFVVVAPGTDQAGAVRLADRLLGLLESSTGGSTAAWPSGAPHLRAGCYAIGGSEPVNPEDLLFRATMALRRAQSDDDGLPVRSYGA